MSAWNVFRFSADILHLASIFLLLLKIYAQRSCAGISLKTQILYVVVFISRYMDVVWNFKYMYNTLMKIFFIATSIAIVRLMKFVKPYKTTYEAKRDRFNIWLLVVPCAALALMFHPEFSFTEVFWAFSLYLEAVAIVPQLVVVQDSAKEHSGRVENLTSNYVFCLGGYRAMYLINWIYRMASEAHYRDYYSWLAGVVQTVIFIDFFYYYAKSKWSGETMSLPV
eukprot:43427_1